MVSIRRRVGMRVAAGLPLRPVAMAERLSEVEAAALLDDAEFQGLVAGYRTFMDLPAAERRRRLVEIAFCELEAAALDGDIKVCCFLLKEDRLRRCPAETLADAIQARMTAMPEPPPAPRPDGSGYVPNPDEGPRWCADGARRVSDAILGDLAAAPLPLDPATPGDAAPDQAADATQAEPGAPVAADAAAAPAPAARLHRPFSAAALLRRALVGGASGMALGADAAARDVDAHRPRAPGRPWRAQAPPR
jgi:hypothetical protein